MYIHPREWTPEINYISGGPFYKRAKRRLIQLFSYSVIQLPYSIRLLRHEFSYLF